MMGDWIKTHWPILVAILAAGTAWGQQQTKIATLEQVVRDQTTLNSNTNNAIVAIKEQNARIEERLKIIIENQERALRSLPAVQERQANGNNNGNTRNQNIGASSANRDRTAN